MKNLARAMRTILIYRMFYTSVHQQRQHLIFVHHSNSYWKVLKLYNQHFMNIN